MFIWYFKLFMARNFLRCSSRTLEYVGKSRLVMLCALLCGLVLSIAPAEAATKFARTAGGNWSADATWSTSSGGAADTVAPTAADDVVLDANSGNVTIDAAAVCRAGRSTSRQTIHSRGTCPRGKLTARLILSQDATDSNLSMGHIQPHLA